MPLSESRLFEALATNKIKTNWALEEAGVPTSEGIAFIRSAAISKYPMIAEKTEARTRPVQLSESTVIEDILPYISNFRQKHLSVVVKPAGGSQGKGVRIFADTANDNEIARHILELLTKQRKVRKAGVMTADLGDDVIMEERIAPRYFKEKRSWVDWNFRVLVSRDRSGSMAVSALVVRCGVRGKAINISQKAFTTDFKELVLAAGPFASGSRGFQGSRRKNSVKCCARS